MSKLHPMDQQILIAWKELIAKIDAAFDDSPFKGSDAQYEAYLCLASAVIPPQFKWEPLTYFGQTRPQIALMAYFPDLEEVLPHEVAVKHGFVAQPPKKEMH